MEPNSEKYIEGEIYVAINIQVKSIVWEVK